MGFLPFIKEYPAFGPIIGAGITSITVLAVAHFFTKRMRRSEATFEFHRRFHDLLRDQQTLEFQPENTPALAKDQQDNLASKWWIRFFELMGYELHYYQQGLVEQDRFEEWMVWRWHEFHERNHFVQETLGMKYRDAWEMYKNLPGTQGNPVHAFLDKIHAVPSEGTAKQVQKIVRQHRPCVLRF